MIDAIPLGLAELRRIADRAAAAHGRAVLAFVGAGGKTSSIFALARSFAEQGARVLVTTTTRMASPATASAREGKGFGVVLELDSPFSPGAIDRIRCAGPSVVLGAGRRQDEKLSGIHPESLDSVAGFFDYVFVEADGARGLSIKAPAAHEPVIPSCCAVLVGVIGLDALGASMNDRIVHRSELFGPLVGCAPGEAIGMQHLVRLVSSPLGLFKGAPTGASRVVLLNKADTVAPELAEECAAALRSSMAADAVIVGALGVGPEGASR